MLRNPQTWNSGTQVSCLKAMDNPEHAIAGASHVGLTDHKSYIYNPSDMMS